MRDSSKNWAGRLIGLGFAAGALLLAVTVIVFIRRPAAAPETPAPIPVTVTAAAPGAVVAPAQEQLTAAGLMIAFNIAPAADQPDLTTITFTVTDTATGGPAALSAPPAVWIGGQAGRAGAATAEGLTCADRIRLYAQSTFDFRPDVDLNAYFILTLNADASLSVIDPLNGVTGVSQLYALVALPSPGEDWAAGPDGQWLFVTLPALNKVAVVDTTTFELAGTIPVVNHPRRIALQPDGRYLWVGNDPGDGSAGGVSVIDTQTRAVAAQIRTGPGPHEIAFSDTVSGDHPHAAADSDHEPTRYAFVSNGAAGTVTVIDTERLQAVTTLDLGQPITSLDYAAASQAVYAAGRDSVSVINAVTHVLSATAPLAGVQALRFAPGGRWGFAARTAADAVDVLDALTTRVVQTVPAAGGPDQISFTPAYAYLHAAHSAAVTLVDLAQVAAGAAPATVTIIGGQTAPDQAGAAPAAARIASVHGSHVLIANPADESIYYYMEGMNAPMGTFQNYGRTPRAAVVVDRSLHRAGPGQYTATFKLPRAGAYLAALALDAPRLNHCFEFTTAAAAPAVQAALHVEPVSAARAAKIGEPFTLELRVTDPAGAPVAGLNDVYVLATLASGQRSERVRALAGAAGVYSAVFTFSQAGVYSVFVAVPSRQLNLQPLASVTISVTTP